MTRKLRPQQYRAAKMVAEGETDATITNRLKLRRNTLNRWRRMPAFYQAVMDYAENMQQAARYKLAMMRLTSVESLHSDIYSNYGSAAELKQKLELVEYCRNLARETGPNGIEAFPTAPNESDMVPN